MSLTSTVNDEWKRQVGRDCRATMAGTRGRSSVDVTNTLHHRTRGAYRKIRRKLVKRMKRTGNSQFHRPILSVAHPTLECKSSRTFAHIPPESDALHTALNQQVADV
jgi:hypothetical protein